MLAFSEANLTQIILAVIGGVVTIQLTYIRKTSEKVHTLVNSSMGAQLKLVMELSDDKAAKDATPENIEAARLARAAYVEHQRKQAIVDSKER